MAGPRTGWRGGGGRRRPRGRPRSSWGRTRSSCRCSPGSDGCPSSENVAIISVYCSGTYIYIYIFIYFIILFYISYIFSIFYIYIWDLLCFQHIPMAACGQHRGRLQSNVSRMLRVKCVVHWCMHDYIYAGCHKHPFSKFTLSQFFFSILYFHCKNHYVRKNYFSRVKVLIF